MKTTSTAIKLASQICWLCVNVLIALWAVRQIILIVRQMSFEIRNKDLVVGRIV